jgi:hypothetical protein
MTVLRGLLRGRDPLPFARREEGDATVFTKRDPVHETNKEGSGPRDVVTDGDDPNTGGWRFFLWWMLAFLGFPIGGLLALVLVGSVEGAGSSALGGAVAGAMIGAAQWLVLRRYPRVRVGPEWILATALGLALGGALGTLLTGAGTGLGSLLVTGLATGIAVGLLQWGLVLRGRVVLASLWPPVVAIAWPLGWTVTWAAGIDVERGYYVFGASGALIFAAVTGLAMLLMLRGRTRYGPTSLR